MKIVGVIYLVIVLLTIVAVMAAWPEAGRAAAVLEELLSAQVVTAMMVGLGGGEFGPQIKSRLTPAA